MLLAMVLVAIGGCAAGVRLPSCTRGDGGERVYVIDHGWHTDLGIPAAELVGPAAVFRTLFPGARAFVFGFGKRTFFTARVQSWREYLLGPIPGPAAILVTALREAPDSAYGGGRTVTLPLPPGGAAALSAFVWRSVAHDAAGRPRLIATGFYPGSLFYDATPTYALEYTCNAWSADGLRAAGTGVSPDGVIFAGQTMRRARHALQCALAPSPA